MALSVAEIATLRTLIEKMIHELENTGTEAAAGRKPVELDQQAIGRLSRMDAMQHQAMANATHQRNEGLRQRLTAVLVLLDDDDFGYCADCGEAIPFKRLELNPAVQLCISCARG